MSRCGRGGAAPRRRSRPRRAAHRRGGGSYGICSCRMYGTAPAARHIAGLGLRLGRRGSCAVDADDSATAVERHDPAGGVPVAGWLAQRPVLEERDLPGTIELGLAEAGHRAIPAPGDLAANEQVGYVREDAKSGACLPRLGGHLRVAMLEEG